MKTLPFALLATLALSASYLTAQTTPPAPNAAMNMPMTPPVIKPATRAVAVLAPTKGNTLAGTIFFDVTATGVHVHGSISGLAPNSSHGFHIHEFGDLTSEDAMAAGGHFNPENHTHGGPGAAPHHAGDMGNAKADDKGTATIDITIPDISINDTKNPILGHGVVLHANPDDLTAKANPGARIAMGVIGLAKPQ